MKNIVIFGGGSAGWITALLTQKYYPEHKITVIESDSIGILGAGEGTVPHFIQILDKVGIPVSDLVKNCKATLKHGINFENWNGDGQKFFNSFSSTHESLEECQNFLITEHLAKEMPVVDLNLSHRLAANGKVGFSFSEKLLDRQGAITNFDNHSNFALHFDARLLAKYFRKVAEDRGIIRMEGELQSVASDEQKNIKQICLKNGSNVKCDFVFDCSGFARIFIGKFYQTEWESYEKYLPMNTALPFFIEHDGDVKPQTDAIAMKYGWMWRIPVGGRYGCGYVFDSNYITEEHAIQEAEEYFEQKLTSPKTFKFKAGTFKQTLVKNCMAVGLAQSFVEPLEATSIWFSCLNLEDFLSSDGIFSESDIFKKRFNERCLKRNDEVKNFLYLHYLTQRCDSPFWREFREKHPMIDIVKENIELINENQYANNELCYFPPLSWIQVASGLKLFDKNKFRSRMSRFNLNELNLIQNYKMNLLKNHNNMANICISHKDFLDYLRQ